MGWFKKVFRKNNIDDDIRKGVERILGGMNLPPDISNEVKKITLSQMLQHNQMPTAQWNNWTNEKAVEEGYKVSVWVFACCYRLAKSVASVPWVTVEGRGENKRPLPSTPLEKLMGSPNRFWSRQDLIERVTLHLLLAGNAYVAKNRVNKIPVELWVLPPDQVSPVSHPTKYIQNYRIEKANGTHTFEPPENITHIQFTDPSNPLIGMSPLQAAARAVDTDNEAVDWNKSSFQNRAVSSGAFIFNHVLTDDQYENARDRVEEQHQGAENAYAPWVLGADAKWFPMSMNAIEMDFLNSRKMSMQEICAVFQVPPPLIGIYDDATLANLDASRQIFWEDTVIPLLDDLEAAWGRTLIPEFYGPETDIRLTYSLKHVPAFHLLFKQNVDIASKLWQMGVPFDTINARLDLGFDKIPGGDQGYLPGNMMPAGVLGMDTFGGDEE